MIDSETVCFACHNWTVTSCHPMEDSKLLTLNCTDSTVALLKALQG